jgi:large subunit ribosomal protein L3
MIEAIMGRKVGITQIFRPDGTIVPVTVIQAGPCYVTQIRTKEKEGYEAVQLGFGEAKRLNKAERGHLKNLPALAVLREVEATEIDKIELGQKVQADIFEEGEKVDVTGQSKGKGFAGVVKRYHFRGGPKTHGQSDRLRARGSVGSTTTPGRVLKGTRMAGHMGCDRVTVQNLVVVQVDTERNLLLLRGAVPGGRNGLVIIRRAIKGRL